MRGEQIEHVKGSSCAARGTRGTESMASRRLLFFPTVGRGSGGCGGRGRRVCGWRAGGRRAGVAGVALSVAATCRLIEFYILYSQ